MIANVILYNTSLSKIEQERERIGTFQALGVTKEQFHKQYFIMGLFYGLISLLTAHVLLTLATLFTSIGSNVPISMGLKEYINYIIKDQLWLYPWITHISISVVFFLTTILTYYLLLQKILDKQPIDNIRNLGR